MMAPSFAGVAVGLWLMVSPHALGYAEPASSVSWIVGPIAASIAFLAAFPITRALRWANVATGVALASAALVLEFPLEARANALAAAGGLVVLAAAAGRAPDRYAGGWRSLLR
jgi:hypothetical protein